MRFANPWVFIACVFIPLVIYLSGKYEYNLNSSFRFPNQGFMGNIKPSLRAFLSRKIVYLRALGLLLLIMAIARPQAPVEETKVFVEGVDMVGTQIIQTFASAGSANDDIYFLEVKDDAATTYLPISSVSANDKISFSITFFI